MISLAEIGENLIECRQLEDQERHVYSTLYTWRKSRGKEGCVALNGVWRSGKLGYQSTLPMSDTEILFEGIIDETLQFLKCEKKKVIEEYLERLYNA